MKSRGLASTMGAGARKSLVLSWTALFLCSLLLQYASVVAPASVLAVHDESFQLDGNAVDAGAGDDWDNHPGADAFTFITDPLSQQTDKIFTGGGSKDDLNTTGWAWTTGSVPDKDNIEHAFAALYDDFLYFGLDRYANNGDAQVGFWFFKNGVGTTGGPNSGGFAPAHAVGDLLVLSDFTNGGAVSTIRLYEWVGSGGDTNGTLDLVASGAICTGAPADDMACAIANTGDEPAPWTYTPKFGTDGTFPAGSFFEGGLDLVDVYNGQPPCFSSFLVETRSSQSVDAVLKDFAIGSFDTCQPPDLATEASTHDADFGATVTDTATLSGNDGPASGTVEFFLCGPSGSYPDCDNGGTKVGATKTVSTTNNGGTATSDAYQVGTTAAAAGKYCFRAEYTPDQASQYLATEHTNKTTECFKVDPATIDIAKTAVPAGPVEAGDPVGFDITVTNTGTTTTLGVSVNDPLPAGVDWTLGAVTGSTTGLVCGISGAVGSEVLTCTKPSLAAGQSFTVHVSGRSDAADCGSISNTASVSTTNDGSDTATASVGVQCPDLSVVKTADAETVNAGDPIGFSITVHNDGPGVARDVTLNDPLPAGVDWAIDGGADAADCSISGAVGSEVLACTFGDLAPGASAFVEVGATTSGDACSVYDNTATASASNHPDVDDDAVITCNTASIDIEKVADHVLVEAGDPIGFTITVSNDGLGDAYGVKVGDPLPAGVTWGFDGDHAGWTIDAGVLSYGGANGVTLAAGDSVSVHITAQTSFVACATYDNTATVTTTNDGRDEANAVIACRKPDLSVVKTADAESVNAGDPIGFSITVHNDGPGVARDVTLNDPLPAGVDWAIDGGADAADCSISGAVGSEVLACTFGDLAPGASASVEVGATTSGDACSVYDNTATASASNHPDVDDDAVITCLWPDLLVDKSADESPISAGDVASFTITVTNDGLGAAYGVELHDQLPNGGIVWHVDRAGCSITGEGDAQELHCDFGTLAAGADASVTVWGETTKDNCGTITNPASATASNEPARLTPNNDSADVIVNCAEITLTKTADPNPVLAGQQIGFTIEVSNNSDGTARNVTITDVLPASPDHPGLSWTVSPAVQGCSISSGILTCNLGDLAPKASVSVHIVSPTTTATCGLVDNKATVTTSNDGSDDDTAQVEVQCASIDLVKIAVGAADGDVLVTQPGDVEFSYLVTNTGTADLQGIVLVDDNATPLDTSDDVTVECLEDTLAAGESMTCTATLPVDFGLRQNWAVVTANPVLEPEAEVSATDDAKVRVPQLVIDKSVSDAELLEGDITTFTLAWTLTDGPVTDGVITDVLPEGLVYLDESATDSDEFEFVDYDEATRTLTWEAATVTKDGSVTYQVAAEDGSADLTQPLENVATIDSDETTPDSDTEKVVVGKVEEETGTPQVTPPATSTVDQAPATGAGNGLMLLLVAIGGLTLLAGLLVPTPARARNRRNHPSRRR